MAVKRGEAPKTIKASLSFTGAAEKFKLGVTYNNVSGAEYRAKQNDPEATVADLVLLIVAEWDADYPLSVDGIAEFDDERPGICDGLIQGYWRARRVDLEKN
ncbi:hypothetical protein ABWU93_11325 [Xanthomonas translucens pv. translucens]|uniref:hypothetical protein n=1 Tax=Xanthomonas campestris pv. translucens TaxID=343 RepID=UPI003F6E86C6